MKRITIFIKGTHSSIIGKLDVNLETITRKFYTSNGTDLWIKGITKDRNLVK